MVAAAAAAKLRSEVGGLNLVKLLNLAPGLVSDSAGDVDFQSHDRHSKSFTRTVPSLLVWVGHSCPTLLTLLLILNLTLPSVSSCPSYAETTDKA